MSWQRYFEKNKGRPVRPIYSKALDFVSSNTSLGNVKVALDLGCGAGIETADLISRGWLVHAFDKEVDAFEAVTRLVPPHDRSRLIVNHQSFEEIEVFPLSDFVYAYHSLPFCRPDCFGRLWEMITHCLRPNGIFAGSLFGMNDEWVQSGDVIGTTQDQLLAFLCDFEILHQEEIDEVGPTALNGPKHWHVINVIAAKKGQTAYPRRMEVTRYDA